ncbi:Nup84p SKDI_04G1300 [Saccharomyces kudriavzevii IFO 1802]|uniref:Uncharacterized protein n=2 Tax=Saccharomyces kudriavzevii (strain ATCC MYA-4449 / AS 2.2408 / CBS 8840 / NBRC 1802 / NCYC 2889) TaxID=226230 RepID=A0AA35JEK1_SACK1|nr:uncharacterized protein SKDI_04G1300 [Saccharomyces kudriavzevii IFO 1802]EJT42050.1 NUP84-like protein [Saccharomyces kudriavzevii IFO 1802]CAI4057449.1 hypothetical protein SKDI_04G1300 [Saccharomyces kudriavzevii IFO 1802]
MDLSPTHQVECFTKFSDTLKEFKIEQNNEQNTFDPFNMIREFRSTAGQFALNLADSTDRKKLISSKDWELEARFWHLVELLLVFRNADIDLDEMCVQPYNSRALFEKKFMQENIQLYQIWIVMVWLKENTHVKERPQNIPTSKWSNSIISGGLKSCDLDYPLRENNNVLDVKDKEEDHLFFKYIYELILAGAVDEALEEAKLADNITICMILCGVQEYLNPNIDVQIASEFDTQQGIKKHSLWRRTVYSLSQQPSLDPYERAIYSYLSSDIPNEEVMQYSDWESDLHLYLNQILGIEIENYLLENNKVDTDELIIPLPSHSLTVHEVLNKVASRHPSESEHPIRALMASVILDSLPSIIHSSVEMLLDVVKGTETSNDIIDKPYLLRIVTHLAIFLNIINPGSIEEVDKSKLITTYISLLKLHGLYENIPIYAAFLSESDCLEAYSFILSSLEDPQIRQKQIEIMNFLRLPASNILRRTTQRVFGETEGEYSPFNEISISFDINDIDMHLIHAVEWLIEGKLYVDAVDSIIALSRRFLLNGRVKALKIFIKRNDIEEICKNYELEKIADDISENEKEDQLLKEIIQYERLVRGIEEYEEWQKSINLLNSESNIPTLIEKLQGFSNDTFELIKTFLVDLTSLDLINSTDYEILYEIRALYTPFLIMELHKKLVEAAKLLKIPKFISEALTFTSLVANENDKIYLLFQSSGKLKEYLDLVARTVTLLK